MASEYWVDGADIEAPDGSVLVMAGTQLPEVPAPRTTSITVPNRSGVIAAPYHVFGTFKVALNVLACGPTRAAADAAWRGVLTRLMAGGRLIQLDYRPAGAPPRTTQAHFVSASTPTLWRSSFVNPKEFGVEAAIVLESVEGAWRDISPVTAAASDLSALNGGTLPVTDAQLILLPASPHTRVTDQVSGSSVSWAGTVPSGRSVLVDCGAYRASSVAGTTWTPSGTDVSSGLSMSAGGFRLTPGSDGRTRVTVEGGSAMVRARRAW